MPLFRRGDRGASEAPAPDESGAVPGDPPPPAPPSPPTVAPAVARFAVTEGDLPCDQRDCPNRNGVRCHYVDRRSRRCDTAWCPLHSASVGGIVYCRRHAGTIAAVGYFEHPAGMPDLDNRAPSLVNWVARDLDAFVAATLVQSAVPGETFVREPVVTAHVDRGGARRYERAWKLVDHTGVQLAVAVFVAGEDDVTVRVRVGSTVVAEGVPPWIERRARGLEVAAEVDRSQRALFYGFLQKHILEAISSYRKRDQRLGIRQ
jgi:hypothetical protein